MFDWQATRSGPLHSDYSYSPTAYEPGGEFYGATDERQKMNRKVNFFMRDLYGVDYFKDSIFLHHSAARSGF